MFGFCVLASMFSLFFVLFSHFSAAFPTWPSPTDELEDIMYLNTGYRARNFSSKVTPCSFSAEGHGRIAAAEWVRTAFHDMAPGNVFTGMGGLDASIAFELSGPTENIGSAFATTLATFSPYLSNQTSMADLIAAGVYTAVRSCGGPIVPIRAGRIDAAKAGPPGVPLPQNSLGTFRNQFARTGFNDSEMIAVTACGHTLGGVHAEDFPQIVTPGSAPNNFTHFDSTNDVFDAKVASEYASGKTNNPLVNGPCTGSGRCSDAAVYGADGNVTISAMANPDIFRKTCAIVLQKMIEVVPKTVTLTDPILPYEVKPIALQLALSDDGEDLAFSGEIRVKTSGFPGTGVKSVGLQYKDRNGGTECGNCTILTKETGKASGFDDKFQFYAFSHQLSTEESISSFNVIVTFTNGSSQTYSNNGGGFPISDEVVVQSHQCNLDPEQDANGNHNLTIAAAIREAEPSSTVNLVLTVQSPRPSGIPVPALQTISVAMKSQLTIGLYTFFVTSYALPSTQVETAKFNILAGSVSDGTQNVRNIGRISYPLQGPNATNITTAASKPQSTPSSMADMKAQGFLYQGCFTDSIASRVLKDKTTWSDKMTGGMCAKFCEGHQYFGLEYKTECYCGNELASTAVAVKQEDCWMNCAGSVGDFCGGTSRITVFKAPKYKAVVAKPAEIKDYAYRGCYTDAVSSRILKDGYFFGEDMTTSKCAALCKGSTYFGTEYGGECYCGRIFPQAAREVDAKECSVACKGDKGELCGAGNRLSVYWKIP